MIFENELYIFWLTDFFIAFVIQQLVSANLQRVDLLVDSVLASEMFHFLYCLLKIFRGVYMSKFGKCLQNIIWIVLVFGQKLVILNIVLDTTLSLNILSINIPFKLRLSEVSNEWTKSQLCKHVFVWDKPKDTFIRIGLAAFGPIGQDSD